MFPEIDLDIIRDNISHVEEQIMSSAYGLVPLYDIKKQEFVIDNRGRVVMEDGVRGSVRMWVEKILYTQLNRYEIYFNNTDYREYGADIKPKFFGKRLPRILVLGELEREIKEALSRHRLIRGIEKFDMHSDGTILRIRFNVLLHDDLDKIEIDEEVRIPSDER